MKLTDEQFLSILRENAGIYSRTARAIRQTFNINYSRSAVYQRAQRFPEELKDIEQANLDIAEEGLHSLMRSTNENVRFKAIDFYLKTKGKSRGYVEKQEINQTVNQKPTKIIFEEVKPVADKKDKADKKSD